MKRILVNTFHGIDAEDVDKKTNDWINKMYDNNINRPDERLMFEVENISGYVDRAYSLTTHYRVVTYSVEQVNKPKR